MAASSAFARSPKAPGVAQTKATEESGPKPIVAVTIRPTWFQNEPTFHLENTVELGIQASPNFAFSYVQDFNTNEAKSGRLSDAGNFDPVWQDGFFRLRFSNVRQSDDKLLSFSDQLRVYLPTEPTKRDAGLVTMIRNYFIFDRKLSDSFAFTFYEVPILHVYDRAGHTNAKNEAEANPIFENRVILEPTIKFGSSITVGLPLNFYLIKYRDFGDTAKLSGEWNPVLTFSPWIEWQILAPLTLGFYYETGSLAQKTDVGLVWSDGQRAGYYQAYVRLAF